MKDKARARLSSMMGPNEHQTQGISDSVSTTSTTTVATTVATSPTTTTALARAGGGEGEGVTDRAIGLESQTPIGPETFYWRYTLEVQDRKINVSLSPPLPHLVYLSYLRV